MTDTIAAIATPLGEGGLAVIRISGRSALGVAARCFRPVGRHALPPTEAPSHTVHYGHIVRGDQVVDEVLLSVLRAPRTYTREDVVEISCHGGLLVARAVLDAALAGGARVAEPGEFTQRAFLNGRLDLAQAEAVADVIHARTERALAAAEEQLAGTLSRKVEQLRGELMQGLAHVEAQLDFPEEDLDPETKGQLADRLERGIAFAEQLLRTAREGQVLRRGVRAVILGRPNVGKSSLLNQLLGHDRAIVSPLPGTTRDTVEETANVRGIPVVLIDTAGLRPPGDPIEAEGIRRSRVSAARADLVLHVLDGSEPLGDEDAVQLGEGGGRPRLLLCNKLDLPRRLVLPAAVKDPCVGVSALTGEGLEAVRDAIERCVWQGRVPAEAHAVAINARHQDALGRARQAMIQARESLEQDRPLELVALELRAASQAVGEIVGQTTTEDLLDQIFRQFCIGK